MKKYRIFDKDKCISEMFEESGFGDTKGELKVLLDLEFEVDDKIVNKQSKEFYNEVKKYVNRYDMKVETKYKIVDKKVKSMVLPLPLDCEKRVERASK